MRACALLLAIVAVAQPLAAQDAAQPAPKLGVKLHVAQTHVQPDGQTDLAIEIAVPADWHVYHPIILDTGMPTTVSFEAPAGVTFGPLRFPEPTPKEETGLKYLSLEDTFHVLTTVSVPEDARAGSLNIKATVKALVCKELCLPVEASATTALKVASGAPQPANRELFDKARDRLPKPLAESPYIKGSSVGVSEATIGVDEETELILKVKVRKGHHIQDRDPGTEFLIPSLLYVEKVNGLKLGDPIWPKPHVKRSKMFGTVRELAGEFEIRVPIKIIDQKFASGPVDLRVLFTYQCCTDQGTCYPPEAAVGVASFEAITDNPAIADRTARGTVWPVVTVAAVSASGGSGTTVSGLAWILLLAFAGGMILNITPCVFPVISIKIISFVQQAGEDRGQILRLGLTFCAGIMVWFWIFGILTGLGEVPLQYPPVTIGLSAVLFVFALSLLGVFEVLLPGGAQGKIGEASGGEGYSGAFMKGLLATLLGTACTAPFFATAAAFAATQPMTITLLIFSAAGVGMSAPYILLSAFPGWLNYLPKPGPWMITFKQIMGFILLGTIVWLLTVLADQLDGQGVVWTISFLGFLGVSCWLVGKMQLNWSTAARLQTWASAALIAVFGLWFSLFQMFDLRLAMDPEYRAARDAHDAEEVTAETVLANLKNATWDDDIPWQHFRPGLAEELAGMGYTVYVDFTASWCVTCQTNTATSLNIASNRKKMREMGVIPIEADYTNRSEPIRQMLIRFGHNSVPMNLVYQAGQPEDPIVLPVILTPGIVRDALDQAGPSTTNLYDASSEPLALSRPPRAEER